jgi:hypothetical protein
MLKSPFADKPIALSLRAVDGMRYRLISCFECGREVLERNGDQIFRLGVNDMPGEVHVGSDGQIRSHCGKCSQQYIVSIAMQVERGKITMELNKQPQTIYVTAEATKQLRDVYCYECGKAFFSISDRITSVVDDIVPLNMIEQTRIGPLEARCRFQHCKQRFHVRV